MGVAIYIKVDDEGDELVTTDTIKLSSGGSLKVKDYRGFTLFEIKENGDLYIKGAIVKS